MNRATRGDDRPGLVDLALLLFVAALFVQLAGQWDLGIWIGDQGRDALWAESVAAGRQYPTLGPAASGVQLQGPVYYLWMGLLRALSIPGWRAGIVLVVLLLGQAALTARGAGPGERRRTALLAVGLGLGQVGLSTFLLTATNPSWVPLLGAAVLAVLVGWDGSATPRACAARYAAAGALWMLAVQLHLSALVAAPAIAVATLLPRRELRPAAWLGLATGAGAALVVLSGGVSTAVALVRGVVLQQSAAPVATPMVARLAGWIAQPWGLAAWWARHGVLGAVGAAGAVAQWAAVLLGVALAALGVRTARGADRTRLLVVLAWAGGGLLYPLAARTTAFYYLVGALPALHLASGRGLAARRWSTWLGVVALAGANVSMAELGGSLRAAREWRLPASSVWWADSDLHVPTLRAAREVVDRLAEAGISYECAVQSARGGAWVAAMMDGGVLASRLLTAGPDGVCPYGGVLVVTSESGRAAVSPLPGRPPPSWPPSTTPPREPRNLVAPALRPFSSAIDIPASGIASTVTVLTTAPPPELSPDATWQPLGLGRYRIRLDGSAACRIVGRGDPAWVDVAPDSSRDVQPAAGIR